MGHWFSKDASMVIAVPFVECVLFAGRNIRDQKVSSRLSLNLCHSRAKNSSCPNSLFNWTRKKFREGIRSVFFASPNTPRFWLTQQAELNGLKIPYYF